MANITETSAWESTVPLLSTNDSVEGGVNGASNAQAKALANRTRHLFDKASASGLLGKAKSFSGNLNDLVIPGFFYVAASATSKPGGEAGHAFVSAESGATFVSGPITTAVQLFFSVTGTASMRFRGLFGWSAWTNLVTGNDASALTPSGMVAYFAGANAPQGWFKCEGQNVSRSAYAKLFAQIGSTYGAGDGSTTFALPDMRDQFIRGVGPGRELGSAQADSVGPHSHSGTQVTTNNTFQALINGDRNIASVQFLQNQIITGLFNHGGETRPKNIALLACIKY